MEQWEQALGAWQAILGPSGVITAAAACKAAAQATFPTDQQIVAILEPRSEAEVAACLQVAHRHRAPVYPVSMGRNWGYGSRVPPADGAVLLSLSRLNRILDYSEELAYVTVEPGVTFGLISDFLKQQGSALLPPLTGTTPDASLIGNVLERGIGKGPYEDIAARSCGYTVILPTGEIIAVDQSGPPDLAAPLRARHAGPSLQGLFAQSNLGIVTRMTLLLAPAPTWRQHLFFAVSQEAQLAQVIDALRHLLLRSGAALQAEVINAYRVLVTSGRFPFATHDPAQPLPRDSVAASLGEFGGACWFVGTTLWAESAAELAALRGRLVAALSPAATPLPAEPPVPGTSPFTLQDGSPIVYWRKSGPLPERIDPDQDRCGVVWLAPILPMRGADAVATLTEIEQVILREGFEPFITLRMPGGRVVIAIISLIYDRAQVGADERALHCHQTLHDLLARRGLHLYRKSLLDLTVAPAEAAGQQALLTTLKRQLDPHTILAPGRYIRP